MFGLRPDQFQLIRQAERSLRGAGAGAGERRRNLFFSMAVRRPPSDGARRFGSRREQDVGRIAALEAGGAAQGRVARGRCRRGADAQHCVELWRAVVDGHHGRRAGPHRAARRTPRPSADRVCRRGLTRASHAVSVIGAAAENLADGLVLDAARVKQYGTRIQTESRRLRDTVERVLLYAGIEAGHAAAHRMPQPVGTLVSEAVAASQDIDRRGRSHRRRAGTRGPAARPGRCPGAALVSGQPDRQRRQVRRHEPMDRRDGVDGPGPQGPGSARCGHR